MAKRYSILWKPKPKSGGELSGTSGIGLGPFSQVRELTFEMLDAKQLTEVSKEAEFIAPVMATYLIQQRASTLSCLDQNVWGIDAIAARETAFDGSGVRVAMLDTGIDAAHEAFLGLDLRQSDFSGSGNGDRNGHGTHCGGTFFGRTVNGRRIGVAPGVTTALVGKVLRDNGSGDTEMVFAGLKWAIDEGAEVISISLGFDFPGQVHEMVRAGWPPDLATSQVLDDYFRNLKMFEAIVGLARARKPFGIDPLIVAATGNESRREIDPAYKISASVPSVVCDLKVGAAGIQEDRFVIADFSNSGPDVVGPGIDVISAKLGGGLETLSGTSMACPHVAGICALWKERLRNAGKGNGGSVVRSYVIATAKSDRFNHRFDQADFGVGMVQAPLSASS
ncbi:S8 family peptidase [Methylosinus sporium]|uniref:S8 family peptidase n=1 Tax=Methylosinus sporium TaxID=428 RepID=UPI00383B868F